MTYTKTIENDILFPLKDFGDFEIKVPAPCNVLVFVKHSKLVLPSPVAPTDVNLSHQSLLFGQSSVGIRYAVQEVFCEQLFRHSSGVTPGPKYDIPASFSGFSPPRQPPILFVYSSIRNKAHLIEEDKDCSSF